MAKFTALIAVLAAFLVVPALAAAAPTGSQITTPATTTYVTVDKDATSTLHVAGTTVGGTGDIDLRCYNGGTSTVIAGPVPVANGVFSIDAPLPPSLMNAFGQPHPFCMLRAVPTGTTPSGAPDLPSAWQGVFIGWGKREIYRIGSGFGSTPADTVEDYFVSRAQSGAMNDFYSIASCGLCDTYLFVPGSFAPSNPIWWANDALFRTQNGVTGRTSVRIDGIDSYTADSAWGSNPHSLADNPGFPALSETDTVHPETGDLDITERAPYVWCSEDPSVFPPTDASCASFTDSGVHYERSIQQGGNGHMVTIVDHWKSVDGKPHELDAIYSDTERSSNAAMAGHEGRANFTWTPDGFTTYPLNTEIPLPSSVPASMLVKTDATTGLGGDNMNPFGAMTFGSKPSELKLLGLGRAANGTGEWQTRYQRTIPAGAEVSIAVAYTHDFTLASVQWLRQMAEQAVASPAVEIDSPADDSTVDAASVHVTGTASSPDKDLGFRVNGVTVPVAVDGHWSADVPLTEGTNQITAVARNSIGVTKTAIRSVSRPGAPAPAPATGADNPSAPAATPTPILAVKPVRCVVPKLHGKALPKARRLLKRAHCRLGKVVRKASTRVKAGHVLKTRFKAGTRHPAGTRIRVTVARR